MRSAGLPWSFHKWCMRPWTPLPWGFHMELSWIPIVIPWWCTHMRFTASGVVSAGLHEISMVLFVVVCAISYCFMVLSLDAHALPIVISWCCMRVLSRCLHGTSMGHLPWNFHWRPPQCSFQELSSCDFVVVYACSLVLPWCSHSASMAQ